MENINLMVNRFDNYYTLILDSKIKLKVEYINLNILSIEDHVDDNTVIYVNIIENQFYKTKEVGAFKNVIYINQIRFNQREGPIVEIRLSLVSLSQDNIRHIFIRAKKFLK